MRQKYGKLGLRVPAFVTEVRVSWRIREWKRKEGTQTNRHYVAQKFVGGSTGRCPTIAAMDVALEVRNGARDGSDSDRYLARCLPDCCLCSVERARESRGLHPIRALVS